MGKNVIIFGADMSSSVHVNIKAKGILILGEGPTRGSDGTILTAEAKYPINFTQLGKRFIFSLHDIGRTVSYLLILQKYINSKQKTQK